MYNGQSQAASAAIQAFQTHSSSSENAVSMPTANMLQENKSQHHFSVSDRARAWWPSFIVAPAVPAHQPTSSPSPPKSWSASTPRPYHLVSNHPSLTICLSKINVPLPLKFRNTHLRPIHASHHLSHLPLRLPQCLFQFLDFPLQPLRLQRLMQRNPWS